MPDFDRAIAALAAKKHSIITRRDVDVVGGNSEHARTRVDCGRWEQPYPNVFRLAGVPWTYEARVLAATCAAGEGAAASHQCAARLLGYGFNNARVEISVPRQHKFRSKDVIVHTSTDLDRCAVRMINGVPVTETCRTLLDLARYYKGQSLRNAIERARRSKDVDWHDLVACVANHARQGRHGINRMRAAIAAGAGSDEFTDTDSELMALSLIRQYGLPEPRLQYRVFDEGGARLVANMDFAWVDRKKNLEIDGDVHLNPIQQELDHDRDEELRAQFGWSVRRVRWELPVYEPTKFVRIVRAFLR